METKLGQQLDTFAAKLDRQLARESFAPPFPEFLDTTAALQSVIPEHSSPPAADTYETCGNQEEPEATTVSDGKQSPANGNGEGDETQEGTKQQVDGNMTPASRFTSEASRSSSSFNGVRRNSHFSKYLRRQETANKVKKLAEGPLDMFISVVVLLNVLLMIVQIQIAGEVATLSLDGGILPDRSWVGPFFDVTEYVFFTLYLLDLIFRVVMQRKKWLFDQGGPMYMNIIDAVIVLVNAVEILLLPVLDAPELERNASNVKALKILRVTRGFRLIKAVKIFRQLKILLTTCIASMGAFLWSIALLFIFQGMYALVLSQSLHGFIVDSSNDYNTRVWVNRFYGDFFKTLYTMFELTYSGGWPGLVRPVVEKVSSVYALVFLVYVTFVVFAVIRIITALFIKETLAIAANDASLAMEERHRAAESYRQKLEELFGAVDTNDDSWISEVELNRAIHNPLVRDCMGLLDIREKDVTHLFSILDDGDGHVDVHEFLAGITHLKGQARAVDVVIVQHEQHHIRNQCSAIMSKVDALASYVGCAFRAAAVTNSSSKVVVRPDGAPSDREEVVVSGSF